LGLARGLLDAGVKILGTSPDAIDLAEERGAFGEILSKNNLSAPNFGMANSYQESSEIATRIGYPVLVRPSYVLGGRGMEIVYDEESLRGFIDKATAITPNHPVLIDKFLDDAIEIDVDALYDGSDLYLAGVMEHIEEAGVHSGDSACVLPSTSLDKNMFFVAKATGVQLAKAAALIATGVSLIQLRSDGILPKSGDGKANGVSVKEAVLPFNRFRRIDGTGVDTVLGPEMKSTGEVMGIANNFGLAFAKSQIAAFGPLPISGAVFISLSQRDKDSGWRSARGLHELGFKIYSTAGTHSYLTEKGVPSEKVRKNSDPQTDQLSANDLITKGLVQLVINTPFGRGSRQDGFLIRTAAISRSVACITTIPGFKAAVAGISALQKDEFGIKSLQEWMK
ncbi:MAG: ATP-grasp domain-containing protein, partial [Actinobacteria bacterium]|nr:ATP-grasp domain-containing protein [Actinomycetota bacterium]